MHRTKLTYADGRPVSLGDFVDISFPDGPRRARIVMLGDSGAHLAIDPAFLDWVRRDSVIAASQVVIEWIDANPLAHDDSRYAPVGDYLFTQVDADVVRVDR